MLKNFAFRASPIILSNSFQLSEMFFVSSLSQKLEAICKNWICFLWVSARVHPGEVPSSFVLEGFLQFIVNTLDDRAKALRDRFVFMFIPMINIDGVIHGRQRTDTNGVNLNRIYHDPNPELHPVIFAIKNLVLCIREELVYYFDLHAHVRSRGCFFYGNNLYNEEDQMKNLLFCALA